MSESPTDVPALLRQLVARSDRAYFSEGRRTDASLELLADVANRSGASIAIGLVVNGLVINGVFSTPDKFMTAVDDASHANGEGGELGPFSQLVAAAREAQDKDEAVVERYEGAEDFDDVPAGDVPAVTRAVNYPRHVTLEQATIVVGPQLVKVGAIRIDLASVDAWWPGVLQEGLTITEGES